MFKTKIPLNAWTKDVPTYEKNRSQLKEQIFEVNWTFQEISLFLIVVGIFPVKKKKCKVFLDYVGLFLFIVSNSFFLFCYTKYVYNCLPLKENVVTNGESIYSSCLSVSSTMIFLSLWLKRSKLHTLVDTINETKLTKLDQLAVLAFHFLTLVNALLYASVLIPWYVHSMNTCGAPEWLNPLLVCAILWNIFILSAPIFLVLSFSFIYRIKFKSVNGSLKRYIETPSGKNNKKVQMRTIKGIRMRYKNLRLVHNEIESLLNVSVLGNHLFILISLINTMLYLVVSLLENKDNVSYSVGVTGSLLGIVVVFVTASFVEIEAKEIRQPREIILQSEKFLRIPNDEGKELSSLMRQTEVKYRMKPGGLYVLDRKFTLKILGAASTYLVISIQFYLTEEQNEVPDVLPISKSSEEFTPTQGLSTSSL